MRTYGLVLAGILLTTLALPAQQPPPTQPPTQPPAAAPAEPVLDPQRNRLDALLLRWEQEMQKVQTLSAQCTRTTLDKTYQNTEVFEGYTYYMRPNLALLDMKKKNNPQVYEKYLCTGTYLYEYAPQSKEIRVHELPAPKQGQVAEDNFLSFLFGMKAAEAKRRYDLKLYKEDQWYIYIEIFPRFSADKADFQKARLVLNNTSFLPRQLWFEQPNSNEITWDIPKVENGSPLKREHFAPPTNPPQGWTLKRVPKMTTTNAPPRVVRPNQ
jgi:TIGR03009 family protein